GTNTTGLKVTAGGGVNIDNSNTNTLTVSTATSPGSFTLNTEGNLTMNAVMSKETSIALTVGADGTSNTTGNMTLNRTIGGAATRDITVTDFLQGNIAGTGRLTASAGASTFTAIATDGSIGSSTRALNVVASDLTMQASTINS